MFDFRLISNGFGLGHFTCTLRVHRMFKNRKDGLMECPKCKGHGWLGRVKVLSKNLILRVCNHCERIWPEGVDPARTQSIMLADFLKRKGLRMYDLIEVSEEPVKVASGK